MFKELKEALNEIEELTARASKEPWFNFEDQPMFIGVTEQVHGPDLSINGRTNLGRNLQPRYDAEFIARSRTIVPQLVEILRAVLSEIEYPSDMFDGYMEAVVNNIIWKQKENEQRLNEKITKTKERIMEGYD